MSNCPAGFRSCDGLGPAPCATCRGVIAPQERGSYGDMIAYFWQEKGDPTRYIAWDEEKTKREFPDFYKAWTEYKFWHRSLHEEAKKLETQD